jgi:hypothetical protein
VNLIGKPGWIELKDRQVNCEFIWQTGLDGLRGEIRGSFATSRRKFAVNAQVKVHKSKDRLNMSKSTSGNQKREIKRNQKRTGR